MVAAVMDPEASQPSARATTEHVEVRVQLSAGFAAAYDILVPQFEREAGVKVVTSRGVSTGVGPSGTPAESPAASLPML